MGPYRRAAEVEPDAAPVVVCDDDALDVCMPVVRPLVPPLVSPAPARLRSAIAAAALALLVALGMILLGTIAFAR